MTKVKSSTSPTGLSMSPKHTVKGLELPLLTPQPFVESVEQDIVFDPAIHLALEIPKFLRPLKGQEGDKDEYQFPVSPEDESFPGTRQSDHTIHADTHTSSHHTLLTLLALLIAMALRVVLMSYPAPPSMIQFVTHSPRGQTQ
jgi:hypothetical protein